MSETFDLQVDSIAAGGDGVGRHNGMVVFVPRSAPGDVISVEATAHGRLMRGRLVSVRTASPNRVEPRCGHYVADSCGGCQLQHLDYGAQLQAKAGIIRDSLNRIGGLSIALPVVEPSDSPWRYRRKLTLAVTRFGADVVAGLHRIDSPDAVFAIRDCEITDDGVMRAWHTVLSRTHLLPEARELRVAVRSLPTGFAMVVEGGSTWDAAQSLLDEIPDLVELYWQPAGANARRRFHTNGSEASGAAFVQVNAAVAGRLVRYVTGIAAEVAHATAVDAYSGTGDIASALADLGARVTAIEIDRDAHATCRSRLSGNSRAIAASVERALPDALPADLVVVNPPRAGLAPAVLDALQSPRAPNSAPSTLIYVSCNPATLARDLKGLTRYRLKSVRGFDMFPQTAHVETVCALELAA